MAAPPTDAEKARIDCRVADMLYDTFNRDVNNGASLVPPHSIELKAIRTALERAASGCTANQLPVTFYGPINGKLEEVRLTEEQKRQAEQRQAQEKRWSLERYLQSLSPQQDSPMVQDLTLDDDNKEVSDIENKLRFAGELDNEEKNGKRDMLEKGIERAESKRNSLSRRPSSGNDDAIKGMVTRLKECIEKANKQLAEMKDDGGADTLQEITNQTKKKQELQQEVEKLKRRTQGNSTDGQKYVDLKRQHLEEARNAEEAAKGFKEAYKKMEASIELNRRRSQGGASGGHLQIPKPKPSGVSPKHRDNGPGE